MCLIFFIFLTDWEELFGGLSSWEFVLYVQELELEKFISCEVPFSDINKAFGYMLGGDGLRCIIRMDA